MYDIYMDIETDNIRLEELIKRLKKEVNSISYMLKALSGGCILVWVMHIVEGIMRTMYTGMSYTHCRRYYQEDVYWYELFSLLKILSEGCILVWAMLIFEVINRRMYTVMSYTHCWKLYHEDVYWTDIYSLWKALSGGSILVCVMLIIEDINRMMYTGIS